MRTSGAGKWPRQDSVPLIPGAFNLGLPSLLRFASRASLPVWLTWQPIQRMRQVTFRTANSEAQEANLAAWRKAHRWHPHQLRHNYATDVRGQFGLEAAQVLLGHTKADVTQIYAERDMNRAANVAAKIG